MCKFTNNYTCRSDYNTKRAKILIITKNRKGYKNKYMKSHPKIYKALKKKKKCA